MKRYRKDVAAILPDETNVEMTGFCCWIYEGSLPAGTYDLWLTAKIAVPDRECIEVPRSSW